MATSRINIGSRILGVKTICKLIEAASAYTVQYYAVLFNRPTILFTACLHHLFTPEVVSIGRLCHFSTLPIAFETHLTAYARSDS